METGQKGRIDTRKENIIYVGIDLHKETHTAVMLDCWNQKLGEITFENKPSEFHKLTRKVSRFVTEEKTAVYGLENAYGYGRPGGVAAGKELCCERREYGIILRPEKKCADVPET